MGFQMIPPKTFKHRSGFTLIELLVVLSVLIVLTAIIIPTLRIISSDRKVREAARVVESFFSVARDDAMASGFAGVELDSRTLYRLRALPPYSGDDYTATVTVNAAYTPDPFDPMVRLYPLTYTPPPIDPVIVMDGEFIQLRYAGPKYRLRTFTQLVVDPRVQPLPPTNVLLKYQVYRRAARIESSATQLPDRHFVAIDFSGDPAFTFTTIPNTNTITHNPFDGTGPIRILFERNGGIDRVEDQNREGYIPVGPLFFLIAIDEEKYDETSGRILLDNESNLWITVGNTNGSVLVSEMGVSSPTDPIAKRLHDARQPARNRYTARQ